MYIKVVESTIFSNPYPSPPTFFACFSLVKNCSAFCITVSVQINWLKGMHVSVPVSKLWLFYWYTTITLGCDQGEYKLVTGWLPGKLPSWSQEKMFGINKRMLFIAGIFMHCEAGASRIDSVPPSLVLPSKILALKTGLFENR